MVLALGACGGLDNREQEASERLARAWSGQQPTDERLAGNACITERWVDEVGLDALVEAKVLDDDFAPRAKQPPARMPRPVATAFGEAVAGCFDKKTLQADLAESFEGVSAEAQTAYVECMAAIDRDLMARAIGDGRAGQSATEATRALDTAVGRCQEQMQQ